MTPECDGVNLAPDYRTAKHLARTHEQTQCPACKLFHVWVRLPAGSLVTCWGCGERNVDPKTVKDGDEPQCPACIAAEAVQIEALQRDMVAARWADAT